MPSSGGASVGSSGSSSPEKRSPPKAKRPRLSITIEMPEGNDRFCWKCHIEDANVPCTTCQRSFHEYCVPTLRQLQQINQTTGDSVNCASISHSALTGKPKKNDEASDREDDMQDLHNFVCPECLSVIRVERDRRENRQRGPLSKLTKHQLAELLLVAVRSIRPYALDVFHAPVSLEEYPDYKDFVVKPFDLQQLEQLVCKERYSSVEEFVSDLRWIHHNSVVYNGPQNRISSSAVAMLKAADKEVGEMSLCPQCYLHMRKATAMQSNNTSPSSASGTTSAGNGGGSFFSEVCSPPHVVVWAKIRGFPHWPAKVMQVDGDQATVKFFGDHNKSIVSLSNCTLLTLKPPVNQKSKKGSYNTAMDEIDNYVRKYRERFGVEFRYETEQVKLTREIYARLISNFPIECSVSPSAVQRGQSAITVDSASGGIIPESIKPDGTALARVASDRNAEASTNNVVESLIESHQIDKPDANSGKRSETAGKPLGALASGTGGNHLLDELPMDVPDEREDYEGDEERRIKSVIISQVPLLVENEDDDKDSGSEEQNSILESIKRKLNLDKKSDSTDDDKEENGNTKEHTGTLAVDTKITLPVDDRSNSSENRDNRKEDPRNLSNKVLNSNDTVSNHGGASVHDLEKDLKFDIHPDLQLQQMQADTVIVQNHDQQHSCMNNNTGSNSGTSLENGRNEKKLAQISASPEKVRGEPKSSRTERNHQQLSQQPQKTHQQSCRVKDKKGDNDNSSKNSGGLKNSIVKEEAVHDGNRSVMNNMGKRESSRELRMHNTNSNNKGTQQHQRTRMRTAKAGEPREIEDLESPASPPSTVPLTGGLAGTVEDANLLAAAAAAAIGIAGAAAAAAGVQQGKTRANMRSRGSGHFSTDKAVLAGGVLGAVGSLLGVEDTPKSPERTNCCAEVSSTTADTDPPHPSSVANTNAVPATTTVIPKVASGDTFFEKLRQTIEECKEKVGVTGHLSAQLQPIAGAVIGAHPEDEDQEDEEGHEYDESETDVSDTELMPYQQKALQLPSPRKENVAPPGDEAVLLPSASAPCFVHRETQTGGMPIQKAEGWTSADWELHYWNAPRVHPDDKRLNQELVAREMSLLKDKLKLKELAAHKALWQASTTRMTDVVKSKQWCCVCKGLATMTCCWNTSYCSQACQSSHWPVHIKTCERSQQTSKR